MVYGTLLPTAVYFLKQLKGNEWMAVELKDGEDPRLEMAGLYEAYLLG